MGPFLTPLIIVIVIFLLSAIKIGAHWLTANSTGLLIGAGQISTA